MSQWTRQDVGAGDTGGMLSCAAALDGIVAALTMMSGNVRTSAASLGSHVWQGTAGDAFRGRGAAVASDVSSFAGTLSRYASALATYGAEVERIASDFEPLRLQLGDAKSALADSKSEITNATSSRASLDALDRKQSAQRTITRVNGGIDALVDARNAADARLRAALGESPYTAFVLLGRALISTGAQRPFLLDKGDFTTLLLDLTSRVEKGTATAEDVAALHALLGTIMIDPKSASTYLQKLGGTRLTALLVELDRIAANDAAQLATVTELQARLRSTLGIASTIWDRTTSDQFAAALMVGPNAAIAVAYLFGDPEKAPIGAHLTFAMVDALRTWEETHGQPFMMLDSVNRDGRPTSLMLSTLDTFSRDAFDMIIADPADSVLRQVALHPGLALTWLGDDGNLQFWFGTRDWAATSGYNAPAIVWAAIQTVPGALIGPDMDPALVSELARINTEILDLWHDNALTSIRLFNEDGRLALGHVIAAQLAVWVEVSLHESNELVRSALGTGTIRWMGVDGDYAQISREALARLLKIVAPSPGASAIVMEEVRNLSARIVAAVPSGSHRDSYEVAMSKAAALLAIVDGGALANDLSVRQANDLRIAIGGGILGQVIDKAGPLATIGADAATSALSNSYQNRLDEFWSGGSADDRQLRSEALDVLAALGYDYIPASVLEGSGEGLDELLRQVISNYEFTVAWAGMAR
ncbi:WXG100 family type VII secretion target [Cellulomonas sp. Y8]|uniref:WXG100 family type VII secretion target n=1 Tax=Cellulomonas sp. Y8 TaxID=2591145 RepID=UPI003D7548FD